MTQLETLLQNDPNVQQSALAALGKYEDTRGFAARCVETIIGSCMSAQADELCGTVHYERGGNNRNGYRERALETMADEVTLQVPKLKHNTYYPLDTIEHWQRVDSVLVTFPAKWPLCQHS